MVDEFKDEIRDRMDDAGSSSNNNRDTEIPPPVPDTFEEPTVYTGGRLLQDSPLAGTNPGSDTRSIIGFAFLDVGHTVVGTSTFNHFELIGRYLNAVESSPTRGVPFKSDTFGPVEVPGGGGFASQLQEHGFDFTDDDILFISDIQPYTGLYEIAYTARAAEFPESRHLRFLYRNRADDLIQDLFSMKDLYRELQFAGHDPGSFRE